MLQTIEEQREALAAPVESRFVKTDPHVKGPYTTGDFVIWKLNEIFGPDNWEHMVQQGPELVTNNDQNAYAQVLVRLRVQFANGSQVTHDDVGIWPFKATRGSTLEDTAPERYETVIKAAITDGIKACVEYLGICFRPMADQNLYKHITGRARAAAKKEKAPTNVGEAKEQPEPQVAGAQPGDGKPPEDRDEYADIRPGGPKDYMTYYKVTVPVFVDEDGRPLDKIQAADILTESAENDALKATEILIKNFIRKEG